MGSVHTLKAVLIHPSGGSNLPTLTPLIWAHVGAKQISFRNTYICLIIKLIFYLRVSYLGRSSRQGGQEEIGDVFANAKDICKVFI